METGIGLGIDAPTKTPYSMEWDSLIQDKKQRRELVTQRRSSSSLRVGYGEKVKP